MSSVKEHQTENLEGYGNWGKLFHCLKNVIWLHSNLKYQKKKKPNKKKKTNPKSNFQLSQLFQKKYPTL
jgi:hypothetical protein